MRDHASYFSRKRVQANVAGVFPKDVVFAHKKYALSLTGFMKENAEAFSLLGVSYFLDYFASVSRKTVLCDLHDILFRVFLYGFMFSQGPGQDGQWSIVLNVSERVPSKYTQ